MALDTIPPAGPTVKPVRLRDIARHPMAYALMVLGSLVGAFVYAYVNSNSGAFDTCKEDKIKLEARAEKAEQDRDNLYRELLIKNGVIDNVPVTVDSLVKKK